ncbi:hypothetical protein BJ165DRAFT_1482625 [Panaeolus papilionaceus]|nr:hypothetical protein BJ165DRAFT_1482625 [Panaeolus papilionaceus]
MHSFPLPLGVFARLTRSGEGLEVRSRRWVRLGAINSERKRERSNGPQKLGLSLSIVPVRLGADLDRLCAHQRRAVYVCAAEVLEAGTCCLCMSMPIIKPKMTSNKKQFNCS